MAQQVNAVIRPDTQAVAQAVERYRHEPVGILLLLSWRAGLGRKEIHTLTWEQVDTDMLLLHLTDREVPLEAETAEILDQWRARYEKQSAYVAYSPRLRTHLSEASMSVLARNALESVGQYGVTLSELRFDYFLRQTEQQGLPYALRVSGISLSTYKNSLSKKMKALGIEPELRAAEIRAAQGAENGGPNRADREYRLWRIMQQEAHTPAGIALRLTRRLFLTVAEIAALTWEDVDLEAGFLRVAGRDVPMTRDVLTLLREERARRAPEDDPHVILTVRARTPPTVNRLSVLIRESLIRGGLDDVSAAGIRLDALRDRDWEAVRAWVDAKGAITPKTAAELIGTGEAAAWSRLRDFERLGYLVHIGRKYYSAARTPPEERLQEEIFGFLKENGTISCAQAETLLGIPSRQIGYVLRTMAKRGELAVVSWGKYALPENEKS